MGTLKEKFEELSAGIKASGKPAAAWFPKYTSTSLLNADNWWEALAVCEYALDTREDEKLTEGFFELIFSAVMSKSISAKKNMSSGGRR